MKDGFRFGIGPNVLRAQRGEPDNVISSHWGAKAGDKVVLVPKDAIVDSGNGPKVKVGWKPEPWQIVTVEKDYQPMYELYEKAIKKLLGND